MWLPAKGVYGENLRPKSVARKQRVDETKEFIDCEPCVPSAGVWLSVCTPVGRKRGSEEKESEWKTHYAKWKNQFSFAIFPPLRLACVSVCESRIKEKFCSLLLFFLVLVHVTLFLTLFRVLLSYCLCLLLLCLSFGHTQVCHTSASTICRKNYFTLKAFLRVGSEWQWEFFQFFLDSFFFFSFLLFSLAIQIRSSTPKS